MKNCPNSCSFFSVLSVCTGLLIYGMAKSQTSASDLMSIGMGAVDPRSFILWGLPRAGRDGLVSNVFIANLPQLILSGVYYAYNGIFTTFWLARECDTYAIERKSLRVSINPEGAQRSTYFLQLPYRVGIPLIVVSIILHWLCSQSIFLVSVRFDRSLAPSISDSESDFITCAYSPRAILSVIIIAIFMVITVIVLGTRRLPGAMPLPASCSASISALCHLPEQYRTPDIATRLLQWGVTGSEDESEDGQLVGHCSFSSGEVNMPEQGKLYSGVRHRNSPCLELLSEV